MGIPELPQQLRQKPPRLGEGCREGPETHLGHVDHLKPTQDARQLVRSHEGGPLDPHGLCRRQGVTGKEEHVVSLGIRDAWRGPSQNPKPPFRPKSE